MPLPTSADPAIESAIWLTPQLCSDGGPRRDALVTVMTAYLGNAGKAPDPRVQVLPWLQGSPCHSRSAGLRPDLVPAGSRLGGRGCLVHCLAHRHVHGCSEPGYCPRGSRPAARMSDAAASGLIAVSLQ
jgi:hypothetical protein